MGQAVQIMFKVLLLPFCGELWLSEGGGGSVGTLEHRGVQLLLMSETAIDSGRGCWMTSPGAKACFPCPFQAE